MRAVNRTFNSGTMAMVRGPIQCSGWIRVAGCVAACAALGGWFGGVQGGCAGKHSKDPTFVQQRDRAAELAQAQRLQEQAFSAQKSGNYERALELYEQALRIDSSLGAAWHNAGICFMEERQYMEARRSFQRAADLLVTDPRPYESLGVLYLRQGFAREAYEQYGRALERDPYSLEGLRGSTRSIKSLRLVSTDAQARLQRGLEVEPDTRWREIMTTERIRVEAGLREEARR